MYLLTYLLTTKAHDHQACLSAKKLHLSQKTTFSWTSIFCTLVACGILLDTNCRWAHYSGLSLHVCTDCPA